MLIKLRVIFTLKNHEDRCIAQAITNSITITDDHKTQTQSPINVLQNNIYQDNPPLPGAGVFPREFPNHFAPAPFRQSLSTADIQGLWQYRNPKQTQPTPPSATSQNLALVHPTMSTPLSISRRASSSAPSEPHQKKRKASGCGKVPSSLVMTSLQMLESNAISDSASVKSASGMRSVWNPSIPHTTNSVYPPVRQSNYGHVNPALAQYSTNPPTPIHSETNFFSSGPRSQSMENLMTGQQMFSPPNSTHPSQAPSQAPSADSSRVPSPTTNVFLPNNNGFHPNINSFHNNQPGQTRAQGLANSLRQILPDGNLYIGGRTQDPVREPHIARIIPGEGSKSGGIEVTCLGNGFYDGLEVLFGDAHATTTFWHAACIVCILPPAAQAGIVQVRCNHNYLEMPPTQQTYFRYVDDDELQLMKLALTILNHKFTGRTEDAGEIARKTVGQPFSATSPQRAKMAQNGGQHHSVTDLDLALINAVDLEASLLNCLTTIDLDDSLNQPRLNKRRPSGHSMLHYSASLGFYRLAAALLARGANPDLRDNNGMSPMHMASLNNHPNIIRKLRSAGGDPTLRSLRGYTPFELGSTNEVRHVIDVLHRHSRSRSTEATLAQYQRQDSSAGPKQVYWRTHSSARSIELDGKVPNAICAATPHPGGDAASLINQVPSLVHQQVRPRRESITIKKPFLDSDTSGDQNRNDRFIAAVTAWSVWRDQLTTQVQQLQQSVHRTLPALPLPTLPPIPNLPDYQDNIVVRLLVALVPHIYLPSLARDPKDNDYHWWEVLKRTTAPPPYEELYPEGELQDRETRKISELHAAADAATNPKRVAVFDPLIPEKPTIMSTVSFGSGDLPSKEREELLAAHTMKIKRLRSDRNLFFFWVSSYFLTGSHDFSSL